MPSTKASPKAIKGGVSAREFADNAVILRRTWTGIMESYLMKIQLEIYSEPLCVWLREVATKTYETTDLEMFPIKLQSPFRELFFYRTEIQSLAEDDSVDEHLRRDARALNEFVQQPNGLLASIVQDHTRFSEEGKVLSDILWTIFPPNSLLVFDSGAIRECWICRDVFQVASGREKKNRVWVIKGLRIGFDALAMGLAKQEFVIDNPLAGLRILTIADLSLTPISYYKAWGQLEEILHRRADLLGQCLGAEKPSATFKSYKGAAWDGHQLYFWQGVAREPKPRSLDEHVCVDFRYPRGHELNEQLEVISHSTAGARSTARGIIRLRERLFKPRSLHRSRRSDASSETSDSEAEDLQHIPEDLVNAMTYDHTVDTSWTTDAPGTLNLGTLRRLAEVATARFNISREEFFMLFPALVPAFGLWSNSWRLVLSDGLQDVEWNTINFGALQCDQHTKRLLETLIKGHKARLATSKSPVDQRRQGLLLHLCGYVHPLVPNGMMYCAPGSRFRLTKIAGVPG